MQAHILLIIRLIRNSQFVPQKYVKPLEGTDGLYEIWVSLGRKVFRIFCFFNKGHLVTLLYGFRKKTPKMPMSEIEITEKK